MVSSRRYPVATRQAVEAMLCESTLPMVAIAARMGIPYATIRTWNARMTVRARAHGRGPAPDLTALDAALRAHLGHQIAALDRTLHDRDGTIDSTRALRDVCAMKRLLDEIGAQAERGPGRGITAPRPRRVADFDPDGEADGASPQDIAAFRAEIDRRYAAFAAAQAEPGVPEDADGAAAGAAGP